MKWKRTILIILIAIVLLIMFKTQVVHAVTLNPYPANEIWFTAYSTSFRWTQTLICDTLTVNETHAVFTNVYLGLGKMLSNLTVSSINTNATLVQLAESNLTTLLLVSLLGQNATVQLTLPTSPVNVSLNGTDKAIGDGWQWNPVTSLLTVWHIFQAADSAATFTLDGSFGSVTPPSRLPSFLIPIYATIGLCGLLTVAMTIVAFVKFQFNVKIFLGIIISTVTLIICVLFILNFILAASNIV